jgi:hypothetical protein
MVLQPKHAQDTRQRVNRTSSFVQIEALQRFLHNRSISLNGSHFELQAVLKLSKTRSLAKQSLRTVLHYAQYTSIEVLQLMSSKTRLFVES